VENLYLSIFPETILFTKNTLQAFFASWSIKIIQNINEYQPFKGLFSIREYLIYCPESLSFNPQIICISAWSQEWNIMLRWSNFIPSIWHRCPERSCISQREGGSGVLHSSRHLTSHILDGVHIGCSRRPVHCTRQLHKFEQKQLRKRGGWKCNEDKMVTCVLTFFFFFYSRLYFTSMQRFILWKCLLKSCRSLACFLSLEEFSSKFQRKPYLENTGNSLRTEFNWW
jgi:hypothetical protein